jgi:RHH-type rel operon transcriptional repressor/antitoxin RelB
MEFQFRPDREAHLRILCEEMGRSVDDFINEAVLTFMEDYEDGRDAEAEMERIHSGEDQLIPLEEMIAKYGMDDLDLSDGGEAVGPTGSQDPQTDSQLSAHTPSHAA